MNYDNIIMAVSEASGIPAHEIAGPCRRQPVCDARAIAALEMLRAGMSLAQASRALGRHHTTIINARRKYRALYDTCPKFRAKAQACEAACRAGQLNQERCR